MPKAVISIIKGGLGNQLFIYAAARAFALRNGRELFLDTARGFEKDGYGRSYRLDHFPITAMQMPEKWRIAPSLKHIRHKGMRVWNKILPRAHRSYLAERRDLGVEQLTRLTPSKERVTMLGYWQDEAYFRDFADNIRQELSPPTPIDTRNLDLGSALREEGSVFLHVRRKNYPELLPSSYYQSAIKFHQSKAPNLHFYIFGDDLDWAMKSLNFHGSPVTTVDWNSENELLDLWLMSRCRHAIIANSSFSWWGAWLGGDVSEGRLIVAPENPHWNMRPATGWSSIPYEIRD